MPILPFLKLIRPANIITAISDVIAGSAIAGIFLNFQLESTAFFLLIFSTSCLYAAGIILNDVFDLKQDQIERPERPLPKKEIQLMKQCLN